MVVNGAFWYIVSCLGFLLTFSETLDYYFIFDDLFMISTAFSMFYSWQSFQVSSDHDKQSAQTMNLRDVPFVLKEMIHEAHLNIKEWRDEVRTAI